MAASLPFNRRRHASSRTQLPRLVLFVTAPYLIYFSDLFEIALRNHWAHLLMHAHFVVIGYLFYQSLIGIDPIPYRFPYPLRLVSLMLALASHSFFAVALMSSNAVIAGDYLRASTAPGGRTSYKSKPKVRRSPGPLAKFPEYLSCLRCSFRWSRDDERRARQLDRAADRIPMRTWLAYNAMLAERANRKTQLSALLMKILLRLH